MVQTNNNNNNTSTGVYKGAGSTVQVWIASTITQAKPKYTKTKKGNTKDTRQKQQI